MHGKKISTTDEPDSTTTGVADATVAVFARDGHDELLDCLESVLGQTKTWLDLFVTVDDARDELVEFATQWIERNRLRFRHCELLAHSGAVGDVAFEVARTDAVMILDSRDVIHSRCVRALLDALHESGASAVYGMGVGLDADVVGWGYRSVFASGERHLPILIRRSERARLQYPAELGEPGRLVLVPEILYRSGSRSAEVGEIRAGVGSDSGRWSGVVRRVLKAGKICRDEGLGSLVERVAKRLAGRKGTTLLPLARGDVAIRCDLEDRAQRGRPHWKMGRGEVGRYAVLASSDGNYFFHEIRDLIAAGLRELGHEVMIGDERDGFRADVNGHVIVAPHEFFFLGEGEALRRSSWPEGVIVVSTEQPSTRWFALAWECLLKADAVWDINAATALDLRRRGVPSEYLPLGYAASYSGFSRVEALPRNQGTCFLEPAISGTERAGGLLRERPIDVLFIGSYTPRRGSLLASAGATLTNFRTYLHLHDPSLPALEGRTTFMDTATAAGLSQRSKILLNIHHGTDVYFEWHRIVLHGLWQKTLVVSEPCSEAPPFRAGLHYVEADLNEIPRVLEHYLIDPQGQREAQDIADAGHRMLTEECRLSGVLERLTRRVSRGVRDAAEWHADENTQRNNL